MSSSVFGRLSEAVRSANRLLLIAHKKPDGDTLGSSSSMLNWLLREGKDVKAFCLDLPPACFRYLDHIHEYTNDPAVFDEPYDLVVVFDSGDLRYCGVAEFVSRLPAGFLLVNIDHHTTNEKFGHLNLVLTDASSTAEVLHRFYEEQKIFIDPRMATSLLTGLLTDTSSFSNAATNPGAIDAASKLLSAGARIHEIHRSLLHDKTIPALRVWGLLLSRLRYHETYDVVSTYVLAEDLKEIAKELVEGVSNFLNAVTSKTDTILVLQECVDEKIKGSLRSVTRDVSKLAKLFGGGGHTKAAGFTIAGKFEKISNGGVRVIS